MRQIGRAATAAANRTHICCWSCIVCTTVSKRHSTKQPTRMSQLHVCVEIADGFVTLATKLTLMIRATRRTAIRTAKTGWLATTRKGLEKLGWLGLLVIVRTRSPYWPLERSHPVASLASCLLLVDIGQCVWQKQRTGIGRTVELWLLVLHLLLWKARPSVGARKAMRSRNRRHSGKSAARTGTANTCKNEK